MKNTIWKSITVVLSYCVVLFLSKLIAFICDFEVLAVTLFLIVVHTAILGTVYMFGEERP